MRLRLELRRDNAGVWIWVAYRGARPLCLIGPARDIPLEDALHSLDLRTRRLSPAPGDAA